MLRTDILVNTILQYPGDAALEALLDAVSIEDLAYEISEGEFGNKTTNREAKRLYEEGKRVLPSLQKMEAEGSTKSLTNRQISLVIDYYKHVDKAMGQIKKEISKKLASGAITKEHADNWLKILKEAHAEEFSKGVKEIMPKSVTGKTLVHLWRLANVILRHLKVILIGLVGATAVAGAVKYKKGKNKSVIQKSLDYVKKNPGKVGKAGLAGAAVVGAGTIGAAYLSSRKKK